MVDRMLASLERNPGIITLPVNVLPLGADPYILNHSFNVQDQIILEPSDYSSEDNLNNLTREFNKKNLDANTYILLTKTKKFNPLQEPATVYTLLRFSSSTGWIKLTDTNSITNLILIAINITVQKDIAYLFQDPENPIVYK